jgi:hypothetical protein
MKRSIWMAAAVSLSLLTNLALAATFIPNLYPFPNGSGVARTYSADGALDTANPFFQSLGTNGRACVTCHHPSTGWSITPELAQARFEATGGLDPLFRTNDGTNTPAADMSTVEARRTACGMLLNKGLIRIGIGIPENAQFELAGVDDPYGHARSTELSLFRRPLPAANLRFLSDVMWDGRESVLDPSAAAPAIALDLRTSLSNQANGATVGHAQALSSLTPAQRQRIVDFELALTTAQAADQSAGLLNEDGGEGGPLRLFHEPFFLGINDPTTPTHNPRAFTLFDKWSKSDVAARRAVFRGQELFNTRRNTRGGTCTTCHATPNVGSRPATFWFNLGTSDASRRTPDMPLYTLRNKITGVELQTTDPGRALITGSWNDIGRFKTPTLRSLAARAPYFHNGSARDLNEVVDFYILRVGFSFTPEEKGDLVAFMKAL